MLDFITLPDAPSPRTEVELGPNYMGNKLLPGGTGLITGDYYKILVGEVPFNFWTGPVYPNVTCPPPPGATIHNCGNTGCLFNIIDDPTEHNDLSLNDSYIDKLLEMRARYEEVKETWFMPFRGPVSTVACTVAKESYDGHWGPFVGVEAAKNEAI